MQPNDAIFEIVLVDTTEQPIARPTPTLAAGAREKEAAHQKAQLIADLNTEQIHATDFCPGSQHDFQLFKQGRFIMAKQIFILADAGYQGWTSLHSNSQTPAEKSKRNPLSAEQKAVIRKLSRKRILIAAIYSFKLNLQP